MSDNRESIDLHRGPRSRTEKNTNNRHRLRGLFMLAVAVAATVTTGGTPMILIGAGMLFSAVVRSYVNLANNGYLKDLFV